MKNLISNTNDLEVGKLYLPVHMKDVGNSSNIYICLEKNKTFITVYNIKKDITHNLRPDDLVYLEELTE